MCSTGRIKSCRVVFTTFTPFRTYFLLHHNTTCNCLTSITKDNIVQRRARKQATAAGGGGSLNSQQVLSYFFWHLVEMKKPQSRKKALGIIHRYCPMQFTSNQQKEFVRQIKTRLKRISIYKRERLIEIMDKQNQVTRRTFQ